MFEDHEFNGKNVFISGPMTGMYLNNVLEFTATHARLKKLGAREIYDPALEWLIDRGKDKTHEWYMRKCINVLTRIPWDCIVMLRGWSDSEGATLEHDVAVACGVEVIEED